MAGKQILYKDSRVNLYDYDDASALDMRAGL
jgi:hypothetical protein